MNFKHKAAVAAAAAMMSVAGTAHSQAFQGRLADNTPSTTCTVSNYGPSQCTSFFDPALNITILNEWGLVGNLPFSMAADVAASTGLARTGLGGWVLPTGDGSQPAGAMNQYLSIWNSVGGNLAGLAAQFFGVAGQAYWSSSEYLPDPSKAWYAFTGANDGSLFLGYVGKGQPIGVVAVRPGDVALAVPEADTWAMMLAGLSVVAAFSRRRPV